MLSADDDVGPFLHDSLRLPDLARHGGTDLIEDPEELLLLHHHPGAKRHAPPHADKLLEAIEQDQHVVRFVFCLVVVEIGWGLVTHRSPFLIASAQAPTASFARKASRT